MTRRADASRGRGVVVPGLRAAVTARSERFARRWPTTGAVARLDAAKSSDVLTISGLEVWSALYTVNASAASPFLHNAGIYKLDADDVLSETNQPPTTNKVTST